MSAHLPLPRGLRIDDPDFLAILEDRLRRLAAASSSAGPRLIQTTHAMRLARYAPAGQDEGTELYETDREVRYALREGHWRYQSGTMRATYVGRPNDLTVWDAGFLLYVEDYAHTFRWTGTGWEWAPGDDRSDYFRKCRGTPGTGWALCDGAAVTRLKSDLTTEAVTLPDLTPGVYLRGAATYSGTVNDPGEITLSGDTGDTSAGTPAGTVSQPTLSMDSYTPAGTVSQPVFTGTLGTTGNNSTSHTFPLGTSGSVTVAQHPHTHTFTPAGTVSQPTFTGTPATLTGTVSQPTFTGDALAGHHHDLSSGTATLTADPVANLDVLVYYRL